jgi:hypothetical protein
VATSFDEAKLVVNQWLSDGKEELKCLPGVTQSEVS